jgi:hypothetical protein
MKFMYIVLVLCTIAVVGTAIALFVRVRAHMSKSAETRDEQERNHEVTKS